MSDEPYVRPPLEPRRPPSGSPALVYPDELLEGRLYLDVLRAHHLELGTRFLKAAGVLFTLDLFFTACMSRSYALVDGFLDAFDHWNPIVAAPLLRMQIDTLVRIAYTANAPHADEIADYVIGGGEFRRLKDSEGKPLSDSRLLNHAKMAHPWIQDVYDATSGWVHLSPAHVRAAVQLKESEEPNEIGRVVGAIPIRPEQIPLSALQELLGAMTKATEELFGYMEIWESRKGLPSGETRELR